MNLPPSPLAWLQQQRLDPKAVPKPVKLPSSAEQAFDDPAFELRGAGLLDTLELSPLPPGRPVASGFFGGPQGPFAPGLAAQQGVVLSHAGRAPSQEAAAIFGPVLREVLAEAHAEELTKATPVADDLAGDFRWVPVLAADTVAAERLCGEPKLPPVQHELQLARHGVSGRVTGFKEVIRPHQESATKSTSLNRALARDDTSAQLPFLPGGLDPAVIRRRRDQKLQNSQAVSVDLEVVQRLVQLVAGPEASPGSVSSGSALVDDPILGDPRRLLSVPPSWTTTAKPAAAAAAAAEASPASPAAEAGSSGAERAAGSAAGAAPLVIKAHQAAAAGAVSTLPADPEALISQDFLVTRLNRDQRLQRENMSWARQQRDDNFSTTLRQATERSHRQLESEARLLDRLESQLLSPEARQRLREKVAAEAAAAEDGPAMDPAAEAEKPAAAAAAEKISKQRPAALAGIDQMLAGGGPADGSAAPVGPPAVPAGSGYSPFEAMHSAAGPSKGGYSWAVRSPIDPETFHEQLPSPAMKFPFPLDTFQRQAILHLEQGDPVMVAAHTSAGKTVVAEYAIAFSNRHLSRTLYTSPIKTLSNQKFREFRDTFGAKNVGILTGDVTLNPEAPCLILTTEILRSMLYHGADLLRDVGCVIFDEVHYVGDRERGVVWEEVIIMLPEHVNMVFLSATLPNTLEFADWVGRTKQRKVYVVETHKRPVPLQHFLWCGADQGMFKVREGDGPFIADGYRRARAAVNQEQPQQPRPGAAGRDPREQQQDRRNNRPAHNAHGKRVAAQAQRQFGGGGGGQGNFRRGGNQGGETAQWTSLIQYLKQRDLLPVVVFAFSRKLCEQTVRAVRLDLTTSQEKTQIHHFFNQCISRLQGTDRELVQVLELREHLKRGMGVHHAGMLPLLKEVVEMLFARGLVKVLFATETFAMGVNMPAKTVVFHSVQKHDGHGLRPLTPGEYTQMAGRAGRRGLDSVGVVVINCPREKFPQDDMLRQVITGGSTPLQSRFRLSFNMILNLLRQEDLRVEDMIRRSFGEAGVSREEPLRQKQLTRARRLLEHIPAMDARESAQDVCLQPDGGLKDYCDVQDQLSRLRGRILLQMDPKTRSKWLGAGQLVRLVAPDLGLHDPCLGMITKPPLIRSEASSQMSMEEIAENTTIRVVCLAPEGYAPPGGHEDASGEDLPEEHRRVFARLSVEASKPPSAAQPQSAGFGFERPQRRSEFAGLVASGGSSRKPQNKAAKGGKRGGGKGGNKQQELDDLFFGSGGGGSGEASQREDGSAPAAQEQLSSAAAAAEAFSAVFPGAAGAGDPKQQPEGRGYWFLSIPVGDLVGLVKAAPLRWRAADGPEAAAKELQQLARGPELPLARVGRDLGLNKLEHAELDSQLEILQTMLSTHPTRQCPLFQSHWAASHKQQQVSRVIRRLAQYEGVGENLRLHEEFHQRLHACELLGYVSPSGRYPDVLSDDAEEHKGAEDAPGPLRELEFDQTVVLKGRVACEINTCEPLLLTELIVESVLAPLSAAECVALLSCLVYQKSDGPGVENSAALSTPAVGMAYKQLETIAANIARTMERCGMDVVVDEWVRENVHPGMMPLVYEWARGMSFKDVCELAGGEIQEGIIVRCINRLEETCRDVRNGARVIGDPVLYTKMQQAQELIRRDIVFAASLYVA